MRDNKVLDALRSSNATFETKWFWSATKDWLRANVDFAFFLAAFTETPRWTVAFLAVNEPMWVGVPLGVLLSFATARAWRKFFEARNWWLFGFNVASMVIAVIVIAPVLKAMTKVEAQHIDLSLVLDDTWLWVWSVVLALTTFIPLVQLAAVQDVSQVASKPVTQRKAKPVAEAVQPEDDDAQPVQQPDKRTRARQLQSEGLSQVQIAKIVEVDRSTVNRWLSATNGAKAGVQ